MASESKYFEDFPIGEIHTSRGRTITETDVVNFAGLSGDFFELHTDEEFAKTTAFGRRIAHGALIFSISTGLMVQMNLLNDTLIAFYGIEKLRFVKPVFIGDTVHVVKKVAEVMERGAARGVVTFSTSVLNQRDEPVLVYSDKLVIKRRPIPNLPDTPRSPSA
jgi:3-hydroxybutyryl-CoA dehydratase